MQWCGPEKVGKGAVRPFPWPYPMLYSNFLYLHTIVHKLNEIDGIYS